MYKQRCNRNTGILFPTILLCASALVSYSLMFTINSSAYDHPATYFIILLLFCLAAYNIWRFCLVSFEYIWIDNELIIRKKWATYVDAVAVIPSCDIVKYINYDDNATSEGRVLNCCATFKGSLLKHCTVVYKNNEQLEKVLIEPSIELSKIITDSFSSDQKEDQNV